MPRPVLRREPTGATNVRPALRLRATMRSASRALRTFTPLLGLQKIAHAVPLCTLLDQVHLDAQLTSNLQHS